MWIVIRSHGQQEAKGFDGRIWRHRPHVPYMSPWHPTLLHEHQLARRTTKIFYHTHWTFIQPPPFWGNRMCLLWHQLCHTTLHRKGMSSTISLTYSNPLQHDILPESISTHLRFATTAMHAYGHKWACQLVYNPCLVVGLGLSDGEGTERLWSWFIKLIGIKWSSSVSYYGSVDLYHFWLPHSVNAVSGLLTVKLPQLDWRCAKSLIPGSNIALRKVLGNREMLLKGSSRVVAFQ